MTIIEEKAFNAIVSINKKMRDATEINWEERTFNLAKDLYIASLQGLGDYTELDDIKQNPFKFASEFVEKYKSEIEVV